MLLRELGAIICSHLSLVDILALRRVCKQMERYVSLLPLRLHVSRRTTCFSLHVLLQIFPQTRILTFSSASLKKMCLDSWRIVFSLINQPVLDLSNIEWDVSLDWAGRRIFSLGYIKQALQCYERALQLKPNVAVHIHNRGVCLQELGLYNDALLCFEQSLQSDSSDRHSRGRYALCLSHVRENLKCRYSFPKTHTFRSPSLAS